ncbi:sigma-54-dependent Fis family transcriptional regulator [Bradyrhizobium japonicum]|uniref:sigma-54-dependent Fis family transcriptional regulator n=1 Tax=Bradyrhizobium japonicum TaxID=375 RepID=UPI001E4506B9|nr:sigma 54-interacting transcriptional regulator [Bradyrhizobium japonicum]MCD9105357.1 sigma 54-interacting transcriptional regulator [Bradyrhizobium japonicum]MCD9259290.1 sigma 54-interacting transcriptional regulator [Bradyrhizobium japonicum SEMIA 5079]MCD9820237.1 sigma 54-interacting transcriptional regulator [Bradyrhizobium japonicum]MCD9892484.1 sigma 54-interacting transcriptional regulator [Bradyrhizobium japonicum]MCD9908076.1 sigma 54-interacting transcriptional regulator [Bradyr
MAKPPFSLEGYKIPDAAETEQGRPYDERETNRAWENFLTFGDAKRENALVRGVIEESWQRSIKSGVNAHCKGSSFITSPDDLYELRLKNDDLLGSSAQTFRRVAEVLGDAATMLVITDRNGVVLDVGGDQRTIDAGHDIRLEVGAAWGETVTGTNGIGTALVTGKPVHVHAAEHFSEGIKAWTCVGSPIRSPIDGSIIGIIDFSGPQAIFHRHNVALAVIAANHIELALSEKLRLERIRLLEASISRMPGMGSADGVVILDRFGRVIHHNDMASARWRRIAQSRELNIGSQILPSREGLLGKDLAEGLPEELREQRIEPLVVDGVVKGAMLVLASKPRTNPAASEMLPTTRAALMSAKEAIVGCSEALLEVVQKIERAALGRTAILLEGETGVGKELFARLVHAASQKTGKEPFVAFNCGAVSKELLGGELFGHAPGAYTGATREGRPGRFEFANGGVLSLDEIGEMPMDLQPYLLRVLEERAVYRLGDSKARAVDVRLVASTNRNLKQEVAEGRFRKDLYFRIGVVRFTIPPLRERLGDVEILIDHFNRQFATTYSTQPLRFEAATMELLRHYSWPGNVRELRNLIENLVLMTITGIVTPRDLPEDFLEVAPAQPPSISVQSENRATGSEGDEIARFDEMERRAIERAVANAGGNIAAAAEKLGLSRATLYRKLHQYRSRT